MQSDGMQNDEDSEDQQTRPNIGEGIDESDG